MMNADGYPGDRRRHRRFSQPPLCLSIDGRVHIAHDWSLGGFVIDAYAGGLSAGSLFIVDAIGADADSLVAVAIRSRVVRSSDDGQRLTANFLVVDMPAYAVLQRLIDKRMKAADPSQATE